MYSSVYTIRFDTSRVTHSYTYKQQHTEQEQVMHPTHQRINQHIEKTGKLRSNDLDKKVHHASGHQNERETHCDDHKKGATTKTKRRKQ
jgi:hypothetical protein